MGRALKETLKIIEEHKKTSPQYKELMDMLEEIMILREQFRREMKKDVFAVDEKFVAAKLEGELPMVDFAEGDYDLTEPKKYFLSLLEIAEKMNPGETKEISAGLKNGTLDFLEMVRESFLPTFNEEEAEEAEAQKDDESFDLISFFVEESLRPGLEVLAEKYGDIIRRSHWSEGYCPICGKEPKIGEIREEEGYRFLYCTQCGIEWNFMRVKCPFCGNEEQKTLAYFTVEGDERYRVEVCDNCKRYIKTVDFRSTNEKADLEVEDIATIHLDMLANEEGYH
jgi:FdhE protein